MTHGYLKVDRRQAPMMRHSSSPGPDSRMAKLLAVARTLHQPFALEELTVAAWKRFPQAFGLARFREQYPDNNKIVALLAARRGPVHRGFLEKVSPGVYRRGRMPRIGNG